MKNKQQIIQRYKQKIEELQKLLDHYKSELNRLEGMDEVYIPIYDTEKPTVFIESTRKEIEQHAKDMHHCYSDDKQSNSN